MLLLFHNAWSAHHLRPSETHSHIITRPRSQPQPHPQPKSAGTAVHQKPHSKFLRDSANHIVHIARGLRAGTAPKTSYRERICRYGYKNARIAHFTPSRDNKCTTPVKKTYHFPTKKKTSSSIKEDIIHTNIQGILDESLNQSINPAFKSTLTLCHLFSRDPMASRLPPPTLHPTPPPGYSYQWSAARSTSLDQNHIGGPLISIPPENTPPLSHPG